MVWVVGAVAIDMIAMRERFLDGTSNPSDIRLGLGGVGYRVFSNLTTPRRFITALAADPISLWAREALETDGDVSIQHVKDRDAGPPLYLALMESGRLKVAASDFRIVEQALTPEFVAGAIGEPDAGDFLVLDANLSPRLLAGLVEGYAGRMRVVFEPVSVEKSRRHLPALRRLFLTTPTTEELDAFDAADPLLFVRKETSRTCWSRAGRPACACTARVGAPSSRRAWWSTHGTAPGRATSCWHSCSRRFTRASRCRMRCAQPWTGSKSACSRRCRDRPHEDFPRGPGCPGIPAARRRL